MSFTILSSVAIMLLVELSKRYIVPKLGAPGLHACIFVVALAIVLGKSAMTAFPAFGVLIIEAGKLLVGAIAIYEVIWKQIASKVNLPVG